MDSTEIKPEYEYDIIGPLESASISGQAEDIDLAKRKDGEATIYVRKTYVFKASTLAATQAKERFLSEYRLLRSIKHENIVQFSDCEFFPQAGKKWRAYLYMEYCHGGDLAHFLSGGGDNISRKSQLSESQAESILGQAARALLYCHTGIILRNEKVDLDSSWHAPILHRDIKPQNILIAANRDGFIKIKLCDFGLAKHLESIGSTSVVGTIGYMAPEVLSHHPRWTEKADVYALGKTMSAVTQHLATHNLAISDVIRQSTEKDTKSRPSIVGVINQLFTQNEPFPPWTIARQAAQQEQIDILDRLQSLNEDILEPIDDGKTLLHISAMKGWLKALHHLPLLNYSLMDRTKDGRLVMHLAAFGGQNHVIQYLRNVGQDISIRTTNGAMPIHFAAKGGSIKTVTYLSELGQGIGVRDKKGATAMHWAADGGQLEMIDYLRGRGLNIMASDSNGWTAIHDAANRGALETIKHLIALGADGQFNDKTGDAPIDVAFKKKRPEAVEYFKSLGFRLKAERGQDIETENKWSEKKEIEKRDSNSFFRKFRSKP